MNLDAIRGEDEILRVLRAAQERIRLTENWSQLQFGNWMSDDEQLCAWGALYWVEYRATGGIWCSDSTAWLKAYDCLTIAAKQMGYGGIPHLNDETDHSTVMVMYTRAQELRLAAMMEAVGAL